MIVKGSILARSRIVVAEETMEALCTYVADELSGYETAAGLVVPMQSYLAHSAR